MLSNSFCYHLQEGSFEIFASSVTLGKIEGERAVKAFFVCVCPCPKNLCASEISNDREGVGERYEGE